MRFEIDGRFYNFSSCYRGEREEKYQEGKNEAALKKKSL